MDRAVSGKKSFPPMACVDIDRLPFQWLARKRGGLCLKTTALAIVASLKPQGRILELNPCAEKLGLRQGMRYVEALALAPQLQAEMFPETLKTQCKNELSEILRRFSPRVEPCHQQTSAFYLATDGLIGLYPSLEQWGRKLLSGLRQEGYFAKIAIGYDRFSLRAIARRSDLAPVLILSSPQEERRQAHQVELSRLEVSEKLRVALEEFGLTRLGDFLQLNAESVLDRLGKEAYLFHRSASGELWTPLQPLEEVLPWESRLGLEYGESHREGLLFLLKRLLDPLLHGLHRKQRAVRRVHFEFLLENQEKIAHVLTLAEPTLESLRILDLVRLRLESVQLTSGVIEIYLLLDDVESPREQLTLFQEFVSREWSAANRALARLRAELGDEAVVIAQLHEGHLPAASFLWKPLEKLHPPQAAGAQQELSPLAVRRFLRKPQKLNPLSRSQLRGGPYRIEGGWWRQPQQRDYYYGQLTQESWIWCFQDGAGNWWLQGGVE